MKSFEKRPIVIGSSALQFHLQNDPIIKNLNLNDIDIICYCKNDAMLLIEKITQEWDSYNIETHELVKFDTTCLVLKGKRIYEIQYLNNPGSGTSTEMLFGKKFNIVSGDTYQYPSLSTLLELKWSHRFLRNSPHFYKTMQHIKFLIHRGVKIRDENFVEQREKETYNYTHPNLNVKSKDFFVSNVNYVYDHDSIHLAVKHLSVPAYTLYMEDNAEVQCSREKFFSQPRAVQFMGVLEESYVLALERSQIPNNFEVDPKRSFMMALEKVCTSITSGWFREFAWTNYDIIAQMYSDDYIQKFKTALEQGIVKPYKGNHYE